MTGPSVTGRSSPPTPSQTVGPFFHFGMAWMECAEMVDADTAGAIVIEGRVLDGHGAPVPDAMVEIWQADAGGRFPPDTAPGWTGFGRALTDGAGGFRFVTVTPGAVDDRQAPHIDVSVFARGLIQRVVTRIYLPGDAAAHERDPLLRSVPEPERRATLVAVGEGPVKRFDIHLQGERETVFLAW
jgi:protocatechuate 3,4-dioxygenase alpha subunit